MKNQIARDNSNYLRGKEIRKKLIRYQSARKLNLAPQVLINNSLTRTLDQLEDQIKVCSAWQERHPDRIITAPELASSLKLPDAWYLGLAFGSMPNFLDFFYNRDEI